MRLQSWTALTVLTLAACTDEQPLGVDPRALSPSLDEMSVAAADGFIAPLAVELGTLYGGYSIAYDVNDGGAVVGESDQRAFVWTPGAGIKELPGLVPNQPAGARAVNADGWVAGWARAADGQSHAVKWSPKGVVRDLGTVVAGGYSSATGINRSGQVTGTASDAYGRDVGFLHDGATMAGLLAPGQSNCEGRAINDQGVVALACASHYGGGRGFRYAAGSYEILGVLNGGDRTDVRGINGSGTLVGSSYGYGRAAVIWPRIDLAQSLGGLGGDTWGVDINDAGQAVGFYMPGGRSHVVLFDPKYGNQDVGTAGDARAEPKAMNNLGDIAGWHDGLNNRFLGVVWKSVSRPRLNVKPGEIRLATTKTVTVNLLSDAKFDATRARAASVRLHLDGSETGIPVALRDGVPITSVADVNGDGRRDRTFTFRVDDLKAAGLTRATNSWVLRDLSDPATRRPFHASDATPPKVL